MVKIYYSTELKKWVVCDSENDQIYAAKKTEKLAKQFKKLLEKEFKVLT